MHKEQIHNLARRLENADRLSSTERRALFRDIDLYAKTDLYGAALLCKDHMHKDANMRLPSAVMAADRIGRHFEECTRDPRYSVALQGGRDRQIRQPEDGREYRGPIVGTTPNCLVQRDAETGDLIVHARHALNRSFELTGNEESLAINYPFRAVGGVGLVRELDQNEHPKMGFDKQNSHHHSQKDTHIHGMENSR